VIGTKHLAEEVADVDVLPDGGEAVVRGVERLHAIRAEEGAVGPEDDVQVPRHQRPSLKSGGGWNQKKTRSHRKENTTTNNPSNETVDTFDWNVLHN